MRFVDQATIVVVAGKGGDGCRHFRREKFVPKGGPDGGDGGRGGDVVVQASHRARSLIDFHHRSVHRAEDGEVGGSARKTGKSGASLQLHVPVGTLIFDDETGELLADLVEEGATATVARGGKGGWGNVHFKSSRRQAPDRANSGLTGDERVLRFELKLLADIALVGLPNAGKSTLIRTISASRAEVADYPFTTLTPNLGVVQHLGQTFTVADVPGLIEGASTGAGLGLRFLRHIERCRAIVYLLAADSDLEPAIQWRTLRAELSAHEPALLQRPHIVVLSKIDVLGPEADEALQNLREQIAWKQALGLSAATRTGLRALLDEMAKHAPAARERQLQTWDPLQDG